MASASKADLLKSEAFEAALSEGAECKKEIATSFKKRSKVIYKSFLEAMLEASPLAKQVQSKRKKDRTDAEVEEYKKLKRSISQMYRQAVDFMTDVPEDGKKSRAQKIAEKIMPVAQLLKYIGDSALDSELEKLGVSLNVKPLESVYSGLEGDEGKHDAIKGILNDAASVQKNVKDKAREITETIYSGKVPVELQYSKDTNDTGLKPGDFSKLVDAKAKLLLAATEEQKTAAEQKIHDAAVEKQFEAARATLVRDSMVSFR